MFLSARVHEGAEMCALVPLSNLRKTLALCQPCPPASPKTSSPPSSVALRSPRSTSCSHVQLVPLFSTTWTAACQAPLSMGSSRQEHWSGLPYSPPEDLPNPGLNPGVSCLLHWQVGSLPLSHLGSPLAALKHLETPMPGC